MPEDVKTPELSQFDKLFEEYANAGESYDKLWWYESIKNLPDSPELEALGKVYADKTKALIDYVHDLETKLTPIHVTPPNYICSTCENSSSVYGCDVVHTPTGHKLITSFNCYAPQLEGVEA